MSPTNSVCICPTGFTIIGSDCVKLLNCPYGKYNDGQNNCINCVTNCASCENVTGTCISCINNNAIASVNS